ncbi:uncharacterized protein LOC123918057 [Trifolium pratense]|uniref:uncharacterized protein LOC123918057 n=1 Tax=Trifolium pratense TaxID=57577 RepID=UPI001E694729|nr:uncharacterized protein LOC123918057 [Trifolium pratense]
MFFEQGWLVLRDFYDIWFGGWLSFTYINSNLLSISLTTRWGIDVRYPLHYPRKRIMLANTIVGASARTSAPHSSPPSGPVLSSPFLRSYLKKLTLYDVKSGILVLPWYGFGEFAFAFTFSEVVLVDHTRRCYPCRVQFSVDSNGELACKVTGCWMNFCKKHHLKEGDKIRFAINEPTRNHVVYVCVYPQIGIETTLSYPLSDGSYLPLYVSQQYFVVFP